MGRCVLTRMNIHSDVLAPNIEETELTLLDLGGSWNIRFGSYGSMYEAKMTTQDLEEIVSVASAMLIEHDEWEAAETGDYETEPKFDELNTEAWLDMEAG